MLLGLDRANVNGPTDWQAVAADKRGFKFAYLKVSQGASFVDKLYLPSRKAARQAGIAAGGYHFAEPDGDPVAQAHRFLGLLRPKPGDLPPVLDLEQSFGATPEKVRAYTLAFLRALGEDGLCGLGGTPILYTGPAFARAVRLDLAPILAEYPLWIAHYGVTTPDVPKPWTQATVWQYTSSGRIPGVPGRVDLNRWLIPSGPLAGYTLR